MKKTCTVLAIVLLAVLFSSASMAQLIFIDDFSYPLGLLVPRPPLPHNDDWTQIDGTKTPAIMVTDPGLTYPNYVGSNVGYAVTLNKNGQDAYAHFLIDLHGNSTVVNSGSIYTAAMVMVTAAQTTGDYFLFLGSNGIAKNSCAVYIRQDAVSGFDFGLCKTPTDQPTTPTIYWSSSYVLNTTYLIVLKYTFNTNSSTDDQCDLYISPTLPLDPCVLTSPILTSTSGTDATSPGIDAICLRQGVASIAPTLIVDGLRVGLSCLDFPLPVELSFFTSAVNGRDIQLNWSTKTEKNSDKFEIERSSVVNPTWTVIGSLKAAVLSNSSKNYSYADTKLQSGKYQYRLKMIDNDGSFSYSSVEAAEVAIPKDFAVSQNYPNPFNPTTRIDYQIPADAKVILEVYNIVGQKVVELVNQEQSAGYYTVDFGASKLSSGVYIYRLAANDKATGNNFSSIKKMTLLK